MDFPGNFRLRGIVDVAPLAIMVNAFDDTDWHRDDFRQRHYPVHAPTQSIALVYDEDFRYSKPSRQPVLDTLQPVVEPVLGAIATAFAPSTGYLLRMLLTRMMPGTEILPHIDKGASLRLVHRLHIAVATNVDARFCVEDETRNLKPGEIWEINNCRRHGVVNAGDTPRIHLIVDWVTPELAREFLHRQLARGRIDNAGQYP